MYGSGPAQTVFEQALSVCVSRVELCQSRGSMISVTGDSGCVVMLERRS